MRAVLVSAAAAALFAAPALAQQSEDPGAPLYLGKQATIQIQQKLDEQGAGAGKADGIWGPETEDAVRKFQQKKDLPATGRLDLQTLAALGVNLSSLAEEGGGKQGGGGQQGGNTAQQQGASQQGGSGQQQAASRQDNGGQQPTGKAAPAMTPGVLCTANSPGCPPTGNAPATTQRPAAK
jgi:peptidoglycan hydrolase-like protein with peptidoglycan-binding domain